MPLLCQNAKQFFDGPVEARRTGQTRTRTVTMQNKQDMTPRYMGIPKYSTVTVAQQNPGGMIAPSKRGHIVRRSRGEHHERPDRTRQRCYI